MVGLDIETTGLDPFLAKPRLLQLKLPDGQIFIVDLFETGTLGPLAGALGTVEIIGHNLIFDLGFLKHHFGVAATKTFDTLLASQILDGGLHLHSKDGFHTLRGVLQRVLGVAINKTEQVSDWSGSLSGSQLSYAAEDVAHLFELRAALTQRLSDRSLSRIMQLESDLLPVFVDLQLVGVPVDVAALDALAAATEKGVADARDRVRRALGIENPNSIPQLLPALRKAGLNVTQTNAEALAPYRDHPVVRDLAAMRTGKKTVDDARVLAKIARSQPDGRVRTSWHQIGATTGRMSASKPNVLGLPKTAAMRACIAAPPGYVFINSDYAAIELRVLAQVADVKLLKKVFAEDGDPHRTLASLLLRKDPKDVTKEERNHVKPVNFGFAFGMEPPRFVGYALKDYGVVFTEDEARRFKRAYLDAYREVDEWQRRTRARMELEVRTFAGRVRAFPNRVDGYTERLNMPVQGTALDGMKEAMVLLGPRLARLGARIVIAVHDELLVEAPESVAEEVKAVVVEGMVEGMRRHVPDVPIKVEADVRRTWGKL